MCLSSRLEDDDTGGMTRGYLAAEGYGARLGHLEQDRTGEDRVSAKSSLRCATHSLLLALHCGCCVLANLPLHHFQECDLPNELWKCAFRITQCCTVHELRRGTIEKVCSMQWFGAVQAY